MDTKVKLYIGSLFALVGAFGLIFGPTLGATMLGKPWSFMVGFLMGVMGGMGAVLSIDGLLKMKQNRR